MTTVGKQVAELLRPVPDFPKEGILFWDIEPVLQDPAVMAEIIEAILDDWHDQEINMVAGFDARGFLFGPQVAQCLGVPFKQIRKKGKLPGPTIEQEYELEYGTGVLEMINDGLVAGKRVLMIDDLLATGGTAQAGADLIRQLGGEPAGLAVVTEIPCLGGRGRLHDLPVQSLVSIIGDKPEWDVEYCVDLLLKNDKNEWVTIRRLSEPRGIAMAGGRIEHGESAVSAIIREAAEELGCAIRDVEVYMTLADRDRDPRGHKVSVVFIAKTDDTEFRGEHGKTEPFLFHQSDGLPPVSMFAFDHGKVFHEHM